VLQQASHAEGMPQVHTDPAGPQAPRLFPPIRLQWCRTTQNRQTCQNLVSESAAVEDEAVMTAVTEPEDVAEVTVVTEETAVNVTAEDAPEVAATKADRDPDPSRDPSRHE